MVKEIHDKKEAPKIDVLTMDELLVLDPKKVPKNEVLTRIADIDDRTNELALVANRLGIKKTVLLLRANVENIEEDSRAYLVWMETPEVRRKELPKTEERV